jgi:hypothetical protein
MLERLNSKYPDDLLLAGSIIWPSCTNFISLQHLNNNPCETPQKVV